MSPWATYAAMVAEITKHDWDFIMKRLSYAKGLQARSIYWLTQHLRSPHITPIEIEPIGAVTQSPLKRIIL